jgi:RHS repeat-associated protein
LNGLSVTNGYDRFLRRTNLTARASTVLSRTAYGYDAASRLATVNDGNNDFVGYSYLANSPLVSQIGFTNGTTRRMTTTKQYDYLNRLTQISSAPSGTGVPPVSFNYNYNAANQRTKNTLVDGSYWIYNYDALGQVTGGNKYFYDGTPVPGQQFGYQFDDIGNRQQTQSGGDALGAGLRLANYTVNNLNQITARDYPGTNDILGAALATNAVTVNGQTAWRKGEYFWATVKSNNTASAQWEGIKVASGGVTNSGNMYVPKTPEQFSYDADGNLTNDGRWTYVWDAENRLVTMTVKTNVGPQYLLTFAYDAKSRRIQKTVTTNGISISTNRFLYDGWNLIAEVGTSGALVRSYVWGNDLSGSLQGAGGVGGLLEVSYYGSSTTNCFPAFDGNGNVMALVNAADGTSVANYAYGPFGELMQKTGLMANNNPFRFSTKYQDDESDLLYYGYRFYKPSTGTWLSKDPIGEKGGKNIYGFLGNAGINKIDAFGLTGINDPPPTATPPKTTSCGKCGPDVTDAVAATLAEVEQEFLDDSNFTSTSDPDDARYSACTGLFDKTRNANSSWEISPLGSNGGSRKAPSHLPPGISPSDFANGGSCGGTVTYQGRCVWSGALNYIIFGKMCKLCNDKFSNRPFETGTLWGTINWSETDMNAAITYHKLSSSGGLLGNPEAQAAYDFAGAGYSGSGYVFPNVDCDTKGVKKWPKGPMPWKWGGVHSHGSNE